MRRKISRRDFLGRSGKAAAGLGIGLVTGELVGAESATAQSTKSVPASEKMVVGVIGCGGMGTADMKQFISNPDVEIAAVCDVYEERLKQAVERTDGKAEPYTDFRKLLERKDIDAVIVAPPDHWHALPTIYACEAGKDVYVEKPLAHTVKEGRAMVRAARRNKRVIQVGTQQRSGAHFRRAVNIVKSGKIGKVVLARCWNVWNSCPDGIGNPPDCDPPEGLDWDMWLGPAHFTEYVPQRTHGSFRWWLEYSGGMMTDWGAHHNDIVQWGLGTERSGPVKIEAQGKAADPGHNCYNTFPEYRVTHTYADGRKLIATNEGENGAHFEGEEGWVFVSRGTIKASDQRLLDDPLPSNATRLYESNDHTGDFLDCMRSRKQPICDAEIGHRSVSICHLGNISLRLSGRRLNWNPKTERFIGDEEANLFVSRPMRRPWRI